MEQLKVFLGTVDIMENTDAVLDSVDDLVKDLECKIYYLSAFKY